MNPFKKNRNAAGLTQQTVADKLGVYQSTVAMWEAGDNKPRADILPQIAKLYNCTIDDLLREPGAGDPGAS